MRPRFRRFRGFRRFKGFRGWWYRPAGDEYKVSVTGFTFVSQVVHAEEPEPPSSGRGVAPLGDGG